MACANGDRTGWGLRRRGATGSVRVMRSSSATFGLEGALCVIILLREWGIAMLLPAVWPFFRKGIVMKMPVNVSAGSIQRLLPTGVSRRLASRVSAATGGGAAECEAARMLSFVADRRLRFAIPNLLIGREYGVQPNLHSAPGTCFMCGPAKAHCRRSQLGACSASQAMSNNAPPGGGRLRNLSEKERFAGGRANREGRRTG